ncbi:unnamed protein product [Prunus brigantina]
MVSAIKLMIGEEQKFQGKALALSHTKSAITTIKEKFSEQQLRTFKESCFGHLLLIEDLKWMSPIVHGLLLRKADPKTVSQVKGIKFIVGNKVIQFTPQQFCVVTGLRFGNLPFIPNVSNENCSLKRKYFRDDKTVSLLELENAFLKCDDADDVLKLGFVYFVVFVLLGSEKNVHIDMRHLKLAEDLQQFEQYPWGAVSYAKTNASLLRALCANYQRVKGPKRAAKTKKTDKKAKTMATGRPREYHLKGFPFAFQGTLASNEVRTLKRELANVARSNQALRNRVHDLEEMVRKEADVEKLPTPEDVAGCDEICKRLLFLLEDWKITPSNPAGGSINPPSLPTVSMGGDEEAPGHGNLPHA